MTGVVEMGTLETDDGKQVPVIDIKDTNGALVCRFVGQITFDSLEAGRHFIMQTHKILTNPIPNTIKYDRNGNAPTVGL